jgi:penicillin amidase
VRTLTNDATANREKRAGLLPVVSKWEGRATTDSASYTLVRAFRRHVTARALDPLFARIVERHPDFNYARLRYQPALDRLLEERPLHLLAPEYATWDDLLLAAADDVLAGLEENGLDPDEATWGRQNTAAIRHPLGRVFPGFLAKLISLPADQLPGDNDVPRVQTPDFGASQRFAVSPGREAEGLFHMPGGQSGHPLSPFFRAGHDAWVKGEPTSFLPGSTQHTLTLKP